MSLQVLSSILEKVIRLSEIIREANLYFKVSKVQTDTKWYVDIMIILLFKKYNNSY